MYPEKEIEDTADENLKATSKSQVSTQLDILEKTKDRLRETIDMLEERLSSVLTNENPSEKSKAIPHEELTPLANRIREQEEELNHQNRKLTNIIQRIEL